MQFRYLIYGLLLAAIFLAAQWMSNLPGIPPVRMPTVDFPALDESTKSDANAPLATDEDRFRLWEDDSRASAQSDITLPPLNDSDSWLRERFSDIALPWLAETELVRTAATVLENASRGQLPRKFLGFLAPIGKFSANVSAGGLRVNPDSYLRYNEFVATLESLPPDRAAEMFRLIEPLLAEAVRELGQTRQSPRELAYTALGVALATPRIDSTIHLEQSKVMYTYADENLENLAPLQKQLLRMGPDNLRIVRIWLEDFGVALSPGNLFDEEGQPSALDEG